MEVEKVITKLTHVSIPVEDYIKLLDRFTGVIPIWLKSSSDKPAPVTFVVLFLIISILIYGTWNARNPQVEKMVNIINSLQPDVVLLAGDIFDDRDINVFEREQMGNILKQIHSEYGVYGILGNHEYISGNADSIIKKYEESNIKMLRDSTVKVQNSFYIIGRDDLSGNRYKDKRKDLNQLMDQVDKKLPIILLDHQPSHLEEADALGVDLQLSGHTHTGQLFPNRFITKRMYEVDWGYLAKNNLQIIVSSGFGTWGPPIRTSSKSEIVDINLQFGEVSKP